MKNNHLKYSFILIFLLLLTLNACKTLKKIAPKETKDVSALNALQTLDENQSRFQWMTSRFSGRVNWKNKTHSIAGSFRMKKDSAIYVSIAPFLGIEVARALITTDSVKFLNRFDATYYLGDINLLNKMFDTDVDFQMLQALFLANDFPHFKDRGFVLEENEKFLQLHNPERIRQDNKGKPINQSLLLNPEDMKIKSNIIFVEESNTRLRADYENYENIKGNWLPAQMKIAFASNQQVSDLSMSFSRTTIDEPKKMRFSIPSKYTLIKLTD
ncbi:MAG: DUF4292 domain-containing protein [Bacteroidota bacterium]